MKIKNSFTKNKNLVDWDDVFSLFGHSKDFFSLKQLMYHKFNLIDDVQLDGNIFTSETMDGSLIFGFNTRALFLRNYSFLPKDEGENIFTNVFIEKNYSGNLPFDLTFSLDDSFYHLKKAFCYENEYSLDSWSDKELLLIAGFDSNDISARNKSRNELLSMVSEKNTFDDNLIFKNFLQATIFFINPCLTLRVEYEFGDNLSSINNIMFFTPDNWYLNEYKHIFERIK